MIDRKKRLRLIQFFLLFFGVLIIYFTYYNNKIIDKNNEIVSKENKDNFKKQDEENIKKEKDLFFNIEYTGLDLNGNRYILLAEKAEYSNSKNYLSIYDNVKINDIKGNLIADKLVFDITKQKLDITSFNNGKINANVNLNEKRF